MRCEECKGRGSVDLFISSVRCDACGGSGDAPGQPALKYTAVHLDIAQQPIDAEMETTWTRAVPAYIGPVQPTLEYAVNVARLGETDAYQEASAKYAAWYRRGQVRHGMVRTSAAEQMPADEIGDAPAPMSDTELAEAWIQNRAEAYMAACADEASAGKARGMYGDWTIQQPMRRVDTARLADAPGTDRPGSQTGALWTDQSTGQQWRKGADGWHTLCDGQRPSDAAEHLFALEKSDACRAASVQRRAAASAFLATMERQAAERVALVACEPRTTDPATLEIEVKF